MRKNWWLDFSSVIGFNILEMKLKYPIINAAVQLVLVIFYVMFGFSKNAYVGLTVLIVLLNLVSYMTMSMSFKKSFQFLFLFSIASFFALVLGLIFVSVLLQLVHNVKFFSGMSGVVQYYNNFGAIRIWFSYFIFSLFPSFLVLSLNFSKRRVTNKNGKRIKVKRRKK